MSLRPLNLLRRAFAGLWWFVDVTRRTLLNLLFLLLVAAVLFAMAKRETPSLQDNTALVLALEGPLVEEMPGSVRDNAIARLGGESMHITRLRDVLAVLESAATDPQITRVVLMLDDFQGAGLASLREYLLVDPDTLAIVAANVPAAACASLAASPFSLSISPETDHQLTAPKKTTLAIDLPNSAAPCVKTATAAPIMATVCSNVMFSSCSPTAALAAGV